MIYFYFGKIYIDLIKRESNKLLNINLIKLVNELNFIFKNVEEDIIKLRYEYSKIITRKSKLTFIDIILYKSGIY